MFLRRGIPFREAPVKAAVNTLMKIIFLREITREILRKVRREISQPREVPFLLKEAPVNTKEAPATI